MTASSSVGSTWTTTSVSGSARSTAASTASAAAWPCPTAASGETAITTSAKWRPAAERIRSRFSWIGGSIAAIACARRLLGVRRCAVHQHVDVAPHQPDGRAQHQRGDEQRRHRVARRPARRAAITRPDEHGERAGEVAAEVERVREERRAVEAPRGPQRRRRARRRRSRARARSTANVHQRGSTSISTQPARRATASAATPTLTSREHRRLEQRREVLGLAVTVLVRRVGRPAGDARPRRTSAAPRRGRCPSAAPRRRGRASRSGCRPRA